MAGGPARWEGRVTKVSPLPRCAQELGKEVPPEPEPGLCGVIVMARSIQPCPPSYLRWVSPQGSVGQTQKTRGQDVLPFVAKATTPRTEGQSPQEGESDKASPWRRRLCRLSGLLSVPYSSLSEGSMG